jgi:hypothetical protein
MSFAQWVADNRLTVNSDRIVYTVDAEDNYTVEFSTHEHLVLHASAKWGTAASRFQHEKMMACQTTVLEFKHYREKGSKFWTAHPGVEFWWVIPKSKLELVPEKGHSYVPVKLNGIRFRLNVSGGTSANGKGWTDWVREQADTSCGFTLKQLRALFDAGMTLEECKAAGVVVDLRHRKGFEELVAAKTPLQPGHVVYLKEGYSFQGSTGPFTVEKKEKQSYLLNVFGMRGKVGPKYIDWVKTVQANGGSIPEGFSWTKLGSITEAA